MGLIGKVLFVTFGRRRGNAVADVKSEFGGGQTFRAEGYGPPGDDSTPLRGDRLAAVPGNRRGSRVAVGYVDADNEREAEPGEKRLYARDEDGNVVVTLWLHGDGSATLYNESGNVSLADDGEVEANGARITTDGDFVTSDGISLRDHFHNQPPDSDGDTQQPTEPPEATE